MIRISDFKQYGSDQTCYQSYLHHRFQPYIELAYLITITQFMGTALGQISQHAEIQQPALHGIVIANYSSNKFSEYVAALKENEKIMSLGQ
ncbi:MAG: hypothetical protein QM488_04360 [Rhizobiaceae bacterium]